MDGRLILELKAVETVGGIRKAQLLTYVKLSGIRTGLLANLNVQRPADGSERLKPQPSVDSALSVVESSSDEWLQRTEYRR